MKYCLIVEDSHDDAFLLQRHLIRCGFLTSICDNTFRALELIRSAKIDVVATDISMPEMSGLDLVKWIRMIDKNIPIVAVTAQVAEHVRIEAYKNGINYFIKKPYSESDIREVFLQFLTTK